MFPELPRLPTVPPATATATATATSVTAIAPAFPPLQLHHSLIPPSTSFASSHNPPQLSHALFAQRGPSPRKSKIPWSQKNASRVTTMADSAEVTQPQTTSIPTSHPTHATTPDPTLDSTPPKQNGLHSPPTHHHPAATASHSQHSHEANFIRPSDLLRPKNLARHPPRPDRPIDRDERAGLVGPNHGHSYIRSSIYRKP